jgi:hypothetical protein
MAAARRRTPPLTPRFETRLRAYERGELGPVMAIFAPDVVFSFQGARDQMHDDLRAAYVADFATRKPGAAGVPHSTRCMPTGASGSCARPGS